MKKSLLALAVLGAFASAAQAQTNVTIGGVVQANVKSYSVGSTARASSNEIRVDDDYTSRFWLTGTEDLGGGNSAIFYIENRISTDVNNVQGVGNGLSNGDTWVGLRGSWGQVTAGKHSWMSTQGLTTEIVTGNGGVGHGAFTAMPTSLFGTFTILNSYNGAGLDVTRRANSVQYVSPNMSGFVVKVGAAASGSNGVEGTLACTGTGFTSIVSVVPAAGSTTQTANCGSLTTAGRSDYSDGRELFLQGAYANGPLNVALGYRNNNVEGRIGTDDRQWRLSGFYVLPMGLKIGLQVDRATRVPVATGVSVSRTAWELPISYVMGMNTLFFSYTRANDASGVSNTGAKLWVLGWDYSFSKRTTAGVYYGKLNNDTLGAYSPFLATTSATGSALAAGESASTFAVGIKHVF